MKKMHKIRGKWRNNWYGKLISFFKISNKNLKKNKQEEKTNIKLVKFNKKVKNSNKIRKAL